MKAKPVTMLLMALALTAALSACGNVDSEPAWKSIESEVESEGLEIVKDEEPEEEEIETTTEEVPEESEDKPEVVESEEVVEEEVVGSEEIVAEEVVESKETVESKAEKTDKTKKTETSPKTDTSAKTSESSAPEQPSAPAQPEVPASTPAPTPAPTSAPTPEPAHEHGWKEHVVTDQVWVPNIVVVDDYEEQIIWYALVICNCGFETTDKETITDHVMAHVYAGEQNNFTVQEHSYTEQVWIGSHEEDQGHYDTSSYVDYYYCDCGATK